MKITRKHTLWIVILAILAGVVLFIVRAKVAGSELPQTMPTIQPQVAPLSRSDYTLVTKLWSLAGHHVPRRPIL